MTTPLNTPLTTPVVLTLFNRPEWTALTFARIAEVKPTHLFLIADGPRPNLPSDAEGCAATRAVVEKIDWDCEVHRDFSDVNMGPRRRLASGISAVFDHVDRAIILEHDILAEPTFFYFAQEMLERYLDDDRVMHISGYNPVGWYNPAASRQRLAPSYPYSYYFSMYGFNWGWATWRRAWQPYYDVDMKLWSPQLEAELRQHPGLNQTMVDVFAQTTRGLNTWDYQWTFARFLQSGLSVVSAQNLVRNIGFGALATNTRDSLTRHAHITSEPQEFPLVHPPWMMRWPSYEQAAQRVHNGVQWRNEIMKRIPKSWFDSARVVARRLEKLRR
jgi:hypothetical protein